ncbi:MAG TPA: acyl carrier protein [Streptosporangiaceae bacterium]|nr:acyl carrier protein [Streptosporangiaceae bacterium]
MDAGHLDGLDVATLARGATRIWADVLGMHEGQEGATFFDLRGQSISAVRILGRLEDEFNVVLDVGFLFDDPDLAAFLNEVVTKASAAHA